MDLLVKAFAGAAIVAVIQLLARTRNAHLAGLVPLFPTFALIAHYLVGAQRTTLELKETIRFGMWSLIPYLVYLAVLYLTVDRLKLSASLCTAVLAWFAAAAILLSLWNRV